MFERVLIANRGEIARRIERTLSRLGVEAIAVYSDADAGAPHVRAADRALRLGPAAAERSYLDVERVVEAALRSGAEAIHPGYGFLSENPALARACAEAGVAFVGPPATAIELLGDKAAAKAAAAAAGVPVLPGLGGVVGAVDGGAAGDGEATSDGDAIGAADGGGTAADGPPAAAAAGPSDAEIAAWLAEAELPVILKAAAGGGGKGMRVVDSPAALPAAIEAARREARAAFGDDRLLAERYLPHSRHIEVQVFADSHGNVIHLGERECSLQRRHQKVVEESPSPVVDAVLRERMGAAAVALARASGYLNAGTVELIAERDDPSRFYFLEVNTRLQVEHPVTEAVTGLDLVELQLRVAAGEPLGVAQEEVRLRGHAAEARVYAEDPANGFLPSSGRVVAYREPAEERAGIGQPAERPGGGRPAALRIDSGVAAGTVVGTDYDPMLAKVVAHAPGREEALRRLRRGLGELVLLGPTTNVPYLRALLDRPEVRAGELDTGLLERLGAEVAPPPMPPELPAVALALLLGSGAGINASAAAAPWPGADRAATAAEVGADPWAAADGWRQAGPAWARTRLAGPAGDLDVAIRRAAALPAGEISPAPEVRSSFGLHMGPNDDRTRWEWEAEGAGGQFELTGERGAGPAGEPDAGLAPPPDGRVAPPPAAAPSPSTGPAAASLLVTVDGETRRVEAHRDGDAVWLLDGATAPARFALADEERAAAGAAPGGSLEAPMPGVVIDVRADPGAAVAAGEVLVLLESMKMELAVQSPRDGTVEAVLVGAGERVERGQALVALAEGAPA